MKELIRLRRSAVVWFLPPAVLIVGIVAPWFLLGDEVGQSTLMRVALVQLAVLALTFGYLRGIFYLAVCWISRQRYVVFSDPDQNLIYLDPRVFKLDVSDIGASEIVHDGSRREHVRIHDLRRGQDRKIATGHFEGQGAGLISVIEGLRAAKQPTARPWGPAA